MQDRDEFLEKEFNFSKVVKNPCMREEYDIKSLKPRENHYVEAEADSRAIIHSSTKDGDDEGKKLHE